MNRKTKKRIRLTDDEAKFYLYNLNYVCSLTWMNGDYKSAEGHLRSRLVLMIKKNPWLLGRITSNIFRGRCYLTYSSTKVCDQGQQIKTAWVGDEDHQQHLSLNRMLEVIPPSSTPITRQTPFSDLSSMIQDAGLFVRKGPHAPLFKVTIIPCSNNPRGKFGLLVQLSHVVGDGATYYKLLNMLCASTPSNSTKEDGTSNIVELIPKRNPKIKEVSIRTFGKKEESQFTSTSNIMRAIRGKVAYSIRGKPTQYHYGWVDESKMKEMKDRAAKEAGLPFVSTNDVITSWFMTHAGCPTGMMCIDTRNRIQGHTDFHAGNYFSFMFYKREDAATPALIRQSLADYKRIVTREEKMPSWWEDATSNLSTVTNWATFGRPLEVEGCTEDIHLPLFQDIPTTYRNLIIFRASNEKKIGLLYVHSDGGVNHLDHAPFVSRK